jgi:hypothetical protein
MPAFKDEIKGASVNETKIKEIDDYIGKKNNKIFLLIFMEGCGPCNATRPEWIKMKNVLSPNFLQKDDIIIASIQNNLADNLENLKNKPGSFPTMQYITDAGETVENYEDSNIKNKDRTIDSFIEWIKLKTGENNITKSEQFGGKTKKKHYRKKSRRKIGGKWSLKYKQSINCSKPKGFSQKQYCKYGRKK